MNARMLSSCLALFYAGAGFCADSAAIEYASKRFEVCMAYSVQRPLAEALSTGCPAARRTRLTSSLDKSLELKKVLPQLAQQVNGAFAGIDCSVEHSAAPVSDALCALTSEEHRMLSRAGARTRMGKSNVFEPLDVSVVGMRRYVRRVVNAARMGGFRRLARDLASFRNDRASRIVQGEVDLLLDQADYVASHLERSPMLLRTADKEDDYSAFLLGLMGGAAQGAAANDVIRTTNTSAVDLQEILLIDTWAQEAAVRYSTSVRDRLRALHLETDNPSEVLWMEQYVAQFMFYLTQRAGHCAVVCAPPSSRQGTAFALPLPIRADLAVALTIRR